MNINKKIKSVKKEIIYKRTVFDMISELRKDALTSKGYFDLEKVPNLRLKDNGLLKQLRGNKTQEEFAKVFNVPLRTLIGWEFYKKAIPLSKLITISKKLGIEKEELYDLIKDCYFSFGSHHGGNKNKLPIQPNEILLKYLIPNKNGNVYVVKTAPDEIKKFVTRHFAIDEHSYNKNGLITIQSFLLNKYLNTFYNYRKKVKLVFPLSQEVSTWISQGVDIKSAVIIPQLLTDGGEKPKNRLFFSGASIALHNIWADAWFYSYNRLPSSYLQKVKNKSIFVTTYNIPNEIMSELKLLSSTFKTSPGGETKEEYVYGSQPSVSYLFQRPSIEQQLAIRIWANTGGSVGIRLDKRDNLITPYIKLACAHPTLIRELQRLYNLSGIGMYITKGDKWSEFSDLRSTSVRSVINFLKIGGFISGTTIASHSRFFSGLDKQEVLLGILEFIDRQREKNNLEFGNKDDIYKFIRNIILSREFKDSQYYLKKFENFDNWSYRRTK